jgi:hypothetical protein
MEESSDPSEAVITQLFRAAEMEAFGPNNPNGDTLAVSEFIMSPGYIHADGYTIPEYFGLADSTDNIYVGILEPHSVSLADFADKWIYVAFHHDSADDNYIDVDDILILGNVVSSTKIAENDLRFVTYPNPVSNYLNVMFRTQKASDVRLELFSHAGQKVSEIPLADGYAGEYNEQFDLRQLPAGSYSVVPTIDGQVFTKNIIRK